MSTQNGSKTFLFVVIHEYEGGGPDVYLVRADRQPDPVELVALLDIDYDPSTDDINTLRYSEDNVPFLPPKA